MNIDNTQLTEKWSPILEGITDATTRENTSVLLENQARHILNESAKTQSLNEDTAVGNLGTFQKFAFPLVRRVFPELIANKIVGVQPMQGPVSQVFYLGNDRSHNGTAESVYGKYDLTYKGNVASALAADGGGESLDDRVASTDTSSMDVSSLADNLLNTVGADIAKYPNDVLKGWSTSAGVDLAGAQIPELNFHIEQQAVIAGTRKFRALWTIEAAQDLKAYHNLDLERELTELLSKEIQLEIDRELIEDLRMVAYNVKGSSNYNGFKRSDLDLGNPNNFPGSDHWMEENTGGNYPSDGKWQYGFTGKTSDTGYAAESNVYFVDLATTALGLAPRHVGQAYANLVAAVNFAAQDIYKTTLRGAGNYIVTSPIVAAMLQSAAKMEGGLESKEAGQLGNNVKYKGKWMGMYDVYIDPLYPEDEMLIGYKGQSAMDAGYVYSPYIPLQMLPTIVDPETFQPRKGLITRYGKTEITPASRFYRIIRIVGADSRFLTMPFAKANVDGIA